MEIFALFTWFAMMLGIATHQASQPEEHIKCKRINAHVMICESNKSICVITDKKTTCKRR